MVEYIERGAVIKIAENYGTTNSSVFCKHSGAAVPVVRCKNCWYSREQDEYEKHYLVPEAIICTNSNFFYDGWNPVWPNDFCPYGEQKAKKSE